MNGKLKGRVKITKTDKNGEILEVIEKDNLIVDVGANLVRDFLAQNGTVSGISVLALGDGTIAPDATQTSLANELYRTGFQSVVTSNNREVKFIAYIGPTDWTGTVAELGLFGNGADPATPGSGTLFSRLVVSTFTKSDAEALTIEWTVTL